MLRGQNADRVARCQPLAPCQRLAPHYQPHSDSLRLWQDASRDTMHVWVAVNGGCACDLAGTSNTSLSEFTCSAPPVCAVPPV